MINKLYEKPLTFRLKVGDGVFWWIVNLVDQVDKKPDCIINHPRKRIVFRTEKGMEVKKYTSLDELIWDIKEEGRKYGLKFEKYKVLKNTAEDKRTVIQEGNIIKKIDVKEKNEETITRILQNNHRKEPYEVTGLIYGNKLSLNGLLQSPVPLVRVNNHSDNIKIFKEIIRDHYQDLFEYDYKNRGYKYFNNKSPNNVVGGFLVPLYWFDHIEYST